MSNKKTVVVTGGAAVIANSRSLFYIGVIIKYYKLFIRDQG